VLINLGRPDGEATRTTHLIVFGVGLLLAAIVRVALWPTPGLTGDLDQFVLWVHGIATAPFSHAYDQNLSFPPVMAYVWGLLAAVGYAVGPLSQGTFELERIPVCELTWGTSRGIR